MAKKSKKVIETKYEVGDIVYFMPTIVDDRSNVFVSVRKDMIVGINISQDTVEYVLKYYQKEVNESDVYDSLTECIDLSVIPLLTSKIK